MIEIPLIYSRDKKGNESLEFVCSTREEANDQLNYLKNRKIVIPETDDSIWEKFGLGFSEREHLRAIMKEFHDQQEEFTYILKYDYLKDEVEEDAEIRKIKVIRVSARNRNNCYIHSVVVLPEDGIENDVHYGKVYKLSLEQVSEEGTIGDINFNDFVIVERPGGFTYNDQQGTNNIRQKEYWLFVKTN